MFKRHLHMLGLLAMAFGSLVVYTNLRGLEAVLLILLGCGLLVKWSCMDKSQWFMAALLLLVLWISAWNFEVACARKWQKIESMEHQKMVVVGVVCAENPFKTDRTELKVEKIDFAFPSQKLGENPLSWLVGHRLLLQIEKPFGYKDQSTVALTSKAFATHGGQRVKVIIQPVLPNRAGNPGFFDHRLYLALRDLWLTAYVSEADLSWQNHQNQVMAFREKLILEIKQRLDRINVQESLGPSLGMLLGFDDFMSDTSVSDYFMAGTVHVLTVSGFHFALVYAVLSGLMKKMPMPYHFRIGLSVAFVLFFLLLTGIKFAPYRAGASMLLMLAAPYFNRRFDLATAASAIVLPELVVTPYKAADMSLMLCYLACLAITHGAWAAKKCTNMERWPVRLKTLCMPVVFLMTVQLSLWLPIMRSSNTVNWLSVPSNLLGTVLSGNLLLMNTVLVVLNLKSRWWCTTLSYINGVGFVAMDVINQFYKLWAGSILYVGDPKGLVAVGYIIVMVVVILAANTPVMKRVGMVRLGLAGLAVLLTVQVGAWQKSQQVELLFLDVGQGDGMVMRTPKGRYLGFDCGTEKFDFQQAVLNTGATTLEKLYLTHGHKDHAGGLMSLNNKVEIKEYLMGAGASFEGELLPKLKNLRCAQVCDGDVTVVDGVRIKAYSAPTASEDENEKGMLYLISFGHTDILITGDAGEEQQRYALSKIAAEGRTLEVIKLSHHGSPKSTPLALAQGMKTGLVVVSVGKNRYGHPSEQLLNGLKSTGAKVIRTDVRGCVQVFSNGQTATVTSFKKGKWALKTSAHFEN